MSFAALINQSINQAKKSLGDLVRPATLRMVAGREYVDGSYVDVTEDIPVEIAPDKFSYMEQQAEDFVQTDVKVILFNPNNDLTPTTRHKIVDEMGRVFEIKKSDPAVIGFYIPTWTLVLRK